MTTQLVERLESLDHNERLQQLVEHSRDLDPAARKALLQDLRHGDTHARWLGIQAAGHAGEIEALWLGLTDPSVMIRSLSAAFIGRTAKEIDGSILEDLDSTSLGVLYARLMRRQEPAISEPLVQSLIAHDRIAEAAALLCSCSDAFILARLRSVAWTDHTWTKISKSRSHLFVQKLEEEFSESSRPEFVWQRYSSSVWALLCDSQPLAVCDWVERFSDADKLPAQLMAGFPALLRHDPTRATGWLASRIAWFSTQSFPAGLARLARKVDPTVLLRLSEGLIFESIDRSTGNVDPAMSRELSFVFNVVRADKFSVLLSNMPYPLRATLFEGATAGLETASIEWSFELLRVLPRHLREREAARMLGLPRGKTDGSWRRRLLGLRDIDKVRESLQTEGRSAQADDRAEAHAALVRSTFGSGKGIDLTLERLARTQNEQDPVRCAFLTAMAEVPGHYFSDPVALDAVIAPSFEARDVSYQTRAAILRIASRLMTSKATTPTNPMFKYAISVLERLAGHQGTPDFPALHPNLPKGAEQSIFLALKPWVDAANSRQQAAHVFVLWRALGERAWLIPEFGELIGDMIWSGNKNHASAAAGYWLADPKTRDKRATELVAKDPSALYLNQVLKHAHQRRQTWLIQRLTIRPPKGRFHDGKVVFVPAFSGGFWRWPTSLQRSYVALIRSAEADTTQYSATRAGLIARRARVPVSSVSDFSGELESAEVVVQEAVLGAIVWTDCPADALPILLQHLAGDRARVAMYAMPRLARLIPRADFVRALSVLLESDKLKVTVHKEALRLLGQAGTAEAVVLLQKEWEKPLHRDVRIAALHAARSLLSRDEAWEILHTGSMSESASVAIAVVQVPVATVAARYRKKYLALMIASADHADPEVRAAFFAAMGSGWEFVDLPLVVDVASRVIARLDEFDPWRAALRVVAKAGRSTVEHPQVIGVLEELIEMAQDATPAGTRDQMAHQRLVALLGALKYDRHPNNLVLVKQVGKLLCDDRDWWGPGAALTLAGAENTEASGVISDLILSVPTALSLIHVVEAASAQAEAPSRVWSAEEAQETVDELCRLTGPARLVAVALISVFGKKYGWGEAWTERIGALRNDDDLDVRTAARRVWIAAA